MTVMYFFEVVYIVAIKFYQTNVDLIISNMLLY